MKKKSAVAAAFLVVLLLLCSAFFACEKKQTADSVVDLIGREVVVPEKVNKVVCVGASALRLYMYVGNIDYLCGVEDFEKGNKMPVRPYFFAYEDLIGTLPSAGSGGANSTFDAEKILSCAPDVVFTTYNDVGDVNRFQQKTGIPVVCLSLGGSDVFGGNLKRSLDLVGRVVGEEERSREVIAYIDELQRDLVSRATLSKEKRSKVYLACNTYNGGKGGICDTMRRFTLFDVLSAVNVAADTDYGTNNPTLDIETLLMKNPDVIFADAFNRDKLWTEYDGKKEIFGAMKAFSTGKVYYLMPFNQYYTNVETAFCDAYYIGSVLYPDAFSDVSIDRKFDEICARFLRKECDYFNRAKALCPDGFERADFSVVK